MGIPKRAPLLETTSRTPTRSTQRFSWELRKIVTLCFMGLGLCGLLYAGIAQTFLRAETVTSTAYEIRQTNTETIANMQATGLYGLGVFEDIDGSMQDLADYSGSVAIVVNVASLCGFTDSNYKGLQELYAKYKEQGLTVLAFPCNQFGQQEPNPCPDIKAFAEKNYKVSFPMFSKVNVNGPDTHPVYKFLKSQLPDVSERGGPDFDLKWNFQKFLVDRDGMPVALFPQQFKKEDIEQSILSLLTPKQ